MINYKRTVSLKAFYWRAWIHGWIWGANVIGAAMLVYFLFGCASPEILGSSKKPDTFSTGPMAVEYLNHSTTASWGIVNVVASGFTREAYRLWVSTDSRSQERGSGVWLVPSGDTTPIEVTFTRDKSGAEDRVMILIENDFEERDPEYSRATVEVRYQ